MTDCVVTSHAGTEDGEPCLQRGAHGGDCPGEPLAPYPIRPMTTGDLCGRPHP